jgi:hypothetical protein
MTSKKEAICSSKMWVTTYKITWHHNPEDHNQQKCYLLNLYNGGAALLLEGKYVHYCQMFDLLVSVLTTLFGIYIVCYQHNSLKHTDQMATKGEYERRMVILCLQWLNFHIVLYHRHSACNINLH